MRATSIAAADPRYAHRSLAIPAEEDDSAKRKAYRPFILEDEITNNDWVAKLELSTVTQMASEDIERTGERIKVLVLTGSLRKRYSKRQPAFKSAC